MPLWVWILLASIATAAIWLPSGAVASRVAHFFSTDEGMESGTEPKELHGSKLLFWAGPISLLLMTFAFLGIVLFFIAAGIADAVVSLAQGIYYRLAHFAKIA